MLVSLIRGYLGATSEHISKIASNTSIPVAKQQGHFHVTLATKDEIRSLRSPYDTVLSEYLANVGDCEDSDLINLGLGCNDKRSVYFLVIHWGKGATWRAKLGLPIKEFHVTLSAEDDHESGIRRDVTAIRCREDFNSALTEREFDKAFLAYYSTKRNDEACSLARYFRAVNPLSPVAHIRFADVMQRQSQHKYAMLAYKHAAELLINGNGTGNLNKMRDYALYMICRTTRFTELPCVYTENELLQADLAKSEGFCDYLDIPTQALRQTVCARFATDVPSISSCDDPSQLPVSLPSRERVFVYTPNGDSFKLPRFFRWLVPYRLAVMSTPRDAKDIEQLARYLGITLVVTLTQETPLPAAWFTGQNVENLFMPVENYKAPSIAQVDHFLTVIENLPSNGAALIHCGAGKGRAGTFAACYMAKYGLGGPVKGTEPRNAGDVIRLLRHMRPGSIETEEQERFVSKYVSHLWKNMGTADSTGLICEPSDTALQLDGPFPSGTRTIVLCGLPGSGKSTFAKRVLECAPGTQVLSQDDLGSRSAFISSLSTAVKSRKHVIVDKCHPTVENRREVLAIAFNPADALCVHFLYPAELCTLRADSRTAHPTIRQGSAGRIVERFAKVFVPPTRKEGFACVATVTSFAAADSLFHRLCGGVRTSNVAASSLPDCPAEVVLPTGSAPPKVGLDIHKFPRTRHLLNIGAATRDDLILSPSDLSAFLDCSGGVTITIEEKVDGANMGISIDTETLVFRVQNRSHYINSKSHEQFKKLDAWLERNAESLRAIIEPGRTVLFGEWMFAQHSVAYSKLPDTFLVFDFYDLKLDKFLSRDKISDKLKGTSLHQVPVIEPLRSPLSMESLVGLAVATRSQFYDGLVEGIYVRRERDGFTVDRAKIVRKDFIAGNDHWGKGHIKQNGIVYG